MSLREILEYVEAKRRVPDNVAAFIDGMVLAQFVEGYPDGSAELNSLGELELSDLRENAMNEDNAALKGQVAAMREALTLFQSALTEHKLRDVRKYSSLCLADAAANKALAGLEVKS